MASVITAPCINTKDTACVDVCPVDGIHPTKSEGLYEKAEQLYIDPDVCIDCGACQSECPVNAIYADADVPADMAKFVDKNRDWYKLSAAEFQAKWGSAGKS